MKTSVDIGAVTLRVPDAANEEFTDSPAPEAPARTPATGWDPYEVWRTRVKHDSDRPERGSRTG
jgi:hypothetical protein